MTLLSESYYCVRSLLNINTDFLPFVDRIFQNQNACRIWQAFLVSFIIYWQAAKWQEYDMWHFQHIFPVAGFYDILK